MANFTPVSAAIGGALIGLSAVLLMLSTGRIAGVSGIFSGLLSLRSEHKGWRVAFIAGLVLAPVIAGLVGHGMATPELPASWAVPVVAGLLVGFGSPALESLATLSPGIIVFVVAMAAGMVLHDGWQRARLLAQRDGQLARADG